MPIHVGKQAIKEMDALNDDVELDSDEYDDLDSGEEASISDEGDSYTREGSSDSETNNVNKNEEDKNVVYGNFGFADALAKVLNSSKPKTKKTLILSKAKKDVDVLKKLDAKENNLGFEIEGVKKEEGVTVEDPDVARRKAHLEKMVRRRRRKEWDLVGRVIPSITEDREREKVLAKIATRGVVQLFNSVKIQQKTIQDKLREAGPLERKREKALKSINKSDFLELLGGNRGNKVDVKKEPKEEATWSVLRDDFMPQVSMRDWDKQESSDSDA